MSCRTRGLILYYKAMALDGVILRLVLPAEERLLLPLAGAVIPGGRGRSAAVSGLKRTAVGDGSGVRGVDDGHGDTGREVTI